LEQRYASMHIDELTALGRNELTSVAQECLEEELARRGIKKNFSTPPPLPQQATALDMNIPPDIATPAHERMAGRVKAVAWLSLVCSLPWLLGLLVLPFEHGSPHSPLLSVLVLTPFCVPLFFAFLGLMWLRPWGRNIALVFAWATSFSPVSWYVIWILSRPETKDLFAVASRARARLGPHTIGELPLQAPMFGAPLALRRAAAALLPRRHLKSQPHLRSSLCSAIAVMANVFHDRHILHDKRVSHAATKRARA